MGSANEPQTDFAIQNLPFGRFRCRSDGWRTGVAIGDQILDLAKAGLVSDAEIKPIMQVSLVDMDRDDGSFGAVPKRLRAAGWRPRSAALPGLAGQSRPRGQAIDIELEVWLQTQEMRNTGFAGDRMSQSNLTDAYWTVAQLAAHHTVNGCNLRTGDLLGTGTLSRPLPEQGGSLLERSVGGRQPLRLSNGQTRAFLEDGDAITLRGRCTRAGLRSIGFGTCSATVTSAAG